MKFWLDAYNIIGQMDGIQLRQSDKVERFIDWVDRHKKSSDHMLIIFDGQNRDVGFPTTEKRSGMTIVHTSGQRSADQYIKDKSQALSDTSAIILVTSDRDILRAATAKRIRSMSPLAFIAYMTKKTEGESPKASPVINERHVDFWLREFGDD